MKAEERKLRMLELTRMFAGLHRHATDAALLAYADASSRIPVRWLRAAVTSILAVWEPSQRAPTPHTLFEHAYRAAGFRAAYSPRCGHTDPTPDELHWWPREGPVAAALAERWGDRSPAVLPENIAVPALRVELAARGESQRVLLLSKGEAPS